MSEALGRVSQVKRVPVAVARTYGLYDDEDILASLDAAEEGAVDIPCWRHAVINFPHPLLQQGLVILDTPGLNAIGDRARAHAQPAARTRTRCCSSSPPTPA